MYLRGLLLELRENVGDGTELQLPYCSSQFFNQGLKYAASGGHLIKLSQQLLALLPSLLDGLFQQCQSLKGCKMITDYAFSACHDRELADALGGIFEVIGPYGRLDIRKGYTDCLQVDFVSGRFWESRLLSPRMN